MEKTGSHGILAPEVLGLDSLETLDALLQVEALTGQKVDPVGAATLQIEPWSRCVEEMETIFPEHWKELARYQASIPLKCDRERYANLEKIDALLLLTARVEGRIVGYFVAFLFPHPHYFGSGLWAMTDMYFVLPEYRTGTGLLMFVALEQECRRRKVTQMVTSCKVHEDHTEFLTKLGWEWTDKTFQKNLAGGKA
jgi:hypothetical protein